MLILICSDTVVIVRVCGISFFFFFVFFFFFFFFFFFIIIILLFYYSIIFYFLFVFNFYFIIVYAYFSSTDDVSDETLRSFLDWFPAILQSSDAVSKDLGIQALAGFVRQTRSRRIFWDSNESKVADILFGIFKDIGSLSLQLQYHVLLVIWLLTFDDVVAKSIQKRYGVISKLVNTAKEAIKEKIIRLVIAIFKNLISIAPKQNTTELIRVGVLPLCHSLKERRWTDDEIMEDLDFLTIKLQHAQDDITYAPFFISFFYFFFFFFFCILFVIFSKIKLFPNCCCIELLTSM